MVGGITGVINPVTAGYVARVIDEAERANAAAVVFTLDTPGGLSDATREITQRFLAARVPIVVYVAPEGARAGSAGVYITYPAHLAAMAPATNIGSATPVALGEGGEQQLSPEMRAKVTNDPDVVGAISLLLAFFGLGALPVNYAGLGLLAFGLALVALEPFIASHGILGTGGAVAFVVGSLLLLTVPDTAPYLRISVAAIAAAGTIVLLASILVLGAVLRGRRRRVTTGREGLVGAIATARLPIRPGEPGLVQVQGELWSAVAGETEVPLGGRVVVEGVEGLLLRVRPLQSEPSHRSGPG